MTLSCRRYDRLWANAFKCTSISHIRTRHPHKRSLLKEATVPLWGQDELIVVLAPAALPIPGLMAAWAIDSCIGSNSGV
jgi:hypothetical protein